MKRKAIMHITNERLAWLLGIGSNVDGEVHFKLDSKMPRDTEITSIQYNGERGSLDIFIEGSGEPLFVVSEGQVIPTLYLVAKSIKKEEPILMELKSEV